MKRIFLFFLTCLVALLLGSESLAQTTHVVNNNGLAFAPSAITIEQGDTIDWQISSNHNVIEVDMSTWSNNMNTPLNGGFSLPFGGGKLAFETPGTFYYVCSPHASAAMKGTITVTASIAEGDAFVAQLSGNQEVPSVPSLASGMVTATLSSDEDSVYVEGSFEGLSSTFDASVGAHLHAGYAGSNGGVEIALMPTLDADSLSGRFDPAMNGFPITVDQLELLRGRQLYVNLHTVAHPGGEVRGG